MRVKMNVCGRTVVVPSKVAEKVMEMCFAEGEVWEDRWTSGKDGKPGFYTTYVYEIDPSKFQYNPEIVTETQYQMFKLAGKPE
jgi:hypothetical protein